MECQWLSLGLNFRVHQDNAVQSIQIYTIRFFFSVCGPRTVDRSKTYRFTDLIENWFSGGRKLRAKSGIRSVFIRSENQFHNIFRFCFLFFLWSNNFGAEIMNNE